MVLAHLGSSVPERRIARLFGGNELGTPSSRVQRLVRWGYEVQYGSSSLERLRATLSQGIAPIVFVQTEFILYWSTATRHAAVLVGIENDTLYVNDPYFENAPQSTSINEFLAAWIEMDEVAAFITKAR